MSRVFELYARYHRHVSRLWTRPVRPDLDSLELPLVIIMTGYNNREYVEDSLYSVLDQDYDNYCVVYIDDCSTDGSQKIIRQVLHEHSEGGRVTVVFNETRKGKLANLYFAIHALSDDDLVVEVDGDDYLYDENVLITLSTVYQTTGALVVHGSYDNCMYDKTVTSLPVLAQPTPWWVKRWSLFRDYPWIYSGLRSYNAGLFKQIRREDLCTKHPLFAPNFFPVGHDAAMFYPMLEMAGERVAFIPQPLIQRNIDSPINDYKVHPLEVRVALREEIAQASRYSRL